MLLEIVPVGMLAANCYILGCEDTKVGVMIDPGGDVLNLLSKIKKLDLSIKYIILTHGHHDHIGAVNEIKKKTNALVAMHKLDEEMLENENKPVKSIGRKIDIVSDIYLKDGDELSIGSINLKIIHTPGHSPGGISILIDGAVFTGDTLFAGSIGRTDFYKGNMEDILSSIKNKLFTLPEYTKVYPGHGPASTIAREKNTNPFFL